MRVRILRGEEEPPVLTEVTLALAAACIVAAGRASTLDEGVVIARDAIASGRAWQKFVEVVRRQGGDVDAIERAHEPSPTEVVLSDRAGFVTSIDPLRLGLLGIDLGAGRRTLDDVIAPQAGIMLYKHIGEHVDRGEPLCGVVEARPGVKADPEALRACFDIGEQRVQTTAAIHEVLAG